MDSRVRSPNACPYLFDVQIFQVWRCLIYGAFGERVLVRSWSDAWLFGVWIWQTWWIGWTRTGTGTVKRVE
jgi:hypothetical protein